MNNPQGDWPRDILLAEDDDDHAVLIEMALDRVKAGMSIRRARNGVEAMEMVRDQPPDLLLLDLKMPGKAGHEVLAEVKGDPELRSVPVAVLTSSDRDEDMAKSYGLGTNHFITKPGSPAELEHRLRSLIRNLAELSDIRRGAGTIGSPAVSRMGPGTEIRRKVVTWGGIAVVLFALFLYAVFSGAF